MEHIGKQPELTNLLPKEIQVAVKGLYDYESANPKPTDIRFLFVVEITNKDLLSNFKNNMVKLGSILMISKRGTHEEIKRLARLIENCPE